MTEHHNLDIKRVAVLFAGGPAPAANAVISATHQSVAAELGTAREVVSRILKEFERRGWLAVTRGEIRVQDAAAIRRFAESR